VLVGVTCWAQERIHQKKSKKKKKKSKTNRLGTPKKTNVFFMPKQGTEILMCWLRKKSAPEKGKKKKKPGKKKKKKQEKNRTKKKGPLARRTALFRAKRPGKGGGTLAKKNGAG